MKTILRLILLLILPAILFAQTDVTIGYGATSGGSWSGGDPDVFTATTYGAKVSTADIESRLNAGTSVTITTTDGSITDSIGVVIRKTAGGDATLKFMAYGPTAYRSYIFFNNNDTIISTSGKLHIIVNADADGNGDGYISGRVYNNGNTSAGIYFASNGGDIIYGGGSDPATTPAYGYPSGFPGVWLNGVKNIASGGTISIRGVGTSGWSGVQMYYATTAQTTIGDVTIHGVGPGGSSGENGVRFGSDSSIIETTSGAISITGTGGSASSYGYTGILISGASRIRSVNGNITLTGTGGSSTYGYCNGIQISGYYVEDPIIETVNGTITVNGTAGSSSSGDAYGLKMEDGGGITASGTGVINITATGGATNYNGHGLKLSAGQSTAGYIHSNSGAITITATGGATTSAGCPGLYLYSYGASGYINSTTGTITIQSTSTCGGDAIFMQGDNTSIESGGDISIIADRSGSGTAGHGITMSFNPKIKAFGAANISITAAGSPSGNPSCGLEMYSGSPLIYSEQGSINITATGGGTTGNGNHGIDMGSGAAIYAAGSGDVRITSTAGYSGYGLNLASNTKIQTDSGSLVISATGTGATWGYGYNRNGSGYGLINNYGDTLSLTLNGSGTDPAMGGYGGSSIGSATFPGELIIRASSLGSDHISLSPFSVTGTGRLTLQPSSASTSIGVAGGSGSFNLSSSDLGAIANGFHAIVVGRSDGSGTISANSYTFSDSVQFISGTGSINLDQTISAGSNSIDIQSNGTVTQNSSASLTSGSMSLSGSGTFTLHPTTGTLTTGISLLTLNGNTQINDALVLGAAEIAAAGNTVTIGSSASNPGSLSRSTGFISGGSLKRWFDASTVSDVIFPFVSSGDDRVASLSFSTAPTTGGTVTASFSSSAPGTNGFPLNDGADVVGYGHSLGYWSLTAGDGLTGGTYGIQLDAESITVPDIDYIHVIKRTNSSSAWTLEGTHGAATSEPNSITRVSRTGLTSFSDFAFGIELGTSPYLSYSSSSFTEKVVNNGSIDNSTPMTITLNGSETLTGSDNDDFVAQGKMTVTNLPAGLIAVATRTSAMTLSVTLTGTAASHASGNGISNLTFAFQNTAFTGGDANAVIFSEKSNLSISYLDPYSPHVVTFDGVDDRLTAPSAIGNFGIGDFTMEAWIKTTSTALGVIAAKRYTSSHENFAVFAVAANGKLMMELDEDISGTNYYGGFSNTAVNDGEWHHVAFTRNGTTMSYYIDGVLDNQETADGPANLNNGTAFSIGALYDNSLNGGSFTGFFTGSVEDLRVWNRSKTQAQIADSMGIELAGSENGLRAYYNFNIGSGTTAYDQTSNAYDATLVNGAAWDVQTFGEISYSDTVFTESSTTAGTIDNSSPVIISLSGMEAFTGSNNDNFVTAGKVTVTNLPSGLTAVITRTSPQTLSVTLTGTAANHRQVNNISNLTFVFQNSAFAGGNASAIPGYSKSNLSINYQAPMVFTRSNGMTTFSKTGSQDPGLAQYQDRITDNVWITRSNSGGGLYNAKNESNWNFGNYDATPSGTEWAFGTTANYASLSYGSWYSKTVGAPYSLVGQDMVLHLIADDIYVDIKFLSWPIGVPGEYSYERSIVITTPTLLYSGTAFTEANANDGSINNTSPVTITFINGSFTGSNGDDFVAGGKVTATNLPAGLTAVVTRTSASSVSVTLTGNASAHAAANNVSNLTLTFQNSAITGGSASSVTNYQKSDLSVSFQNAALSYNRTSFFESSANDGSIDNADPLTITLVGETLTGANSDDFAAEGKITVSNVPSGLTAVATKTSSTTVAVTFTGTAASHAGSNSIQNLTFAFQNNAFSGNNAATITNGTKSDLKIMFDAGQAGSALRFDGTDDYISLPSGTYFSGSFTFETWVYEYAYNSWSRLLDFGNGAGSDNIVIPLSTGTSGQVSLHVFQGGSSQNIQTTTVVPLNQWTHIACVVDNGTGTIYINGVAEVSGPVHVPLNVTRVYNFIGKSNWADALLSASMDEIRLWNVARTQQQIREYMHRTVDPGTSNLVGYWQFNNGSGSTALASAGTDGTLNNFSYNAGSGYISSAIPAAAGTSASTTAFTSGTASMGAVSVTTTEAFDNPVDLTASVLSAIPVTLPDSYVNAVGNKYFVINAFGTPGTFSSDISINFGAASLDNRVDAYPQGIKLYKRASFSDSGWTLVGGAASANFSTGVVTWNGVTSFSQFVAVYEESLLPVELVSFTASSQRLNADLKWKTATEVNNHGFEIQRSAIRTQQSDADNRMLNAKGAVWTKVGFVEGNGNTNVAHEYAYTDRVVTAGKYSYRLKQVDRDGKFGYSQEVEVNIGSAPLVFALSQNYPNPFNPATRIEFTVPVSGKATLKVYNIMGQEVATLFDGIADAGIFHQSVFDASRFSSGVYFARLTSGGQTQLKRMMLVK